MTPQTTSILALLFVITGVCTVFIMLEMTGRTKDLAGKKQWILVHKCLGYFFLLLFAVLFTFMIQKIAGYQEELPARAVIHIVLSLIMVPLVGIKIFLVRRSPRNSTKIPFLGITIFIISFALTGLTAGYYSLHKSNLSYTTLMAQDSDVLDLELGKANMNKKCGKCHSLERIYRAYKSEEGWTVTVNKMAFLDSPNIAGFDVKQITNYLIEQQKRRQKKNQTSPGEEIGKTLVSRKCNICHNLDRVYGAQKNKQKWQATVERMKRTMNDPDFLSRKETTSITNFLSKRRQKE